MAQLSIGTKLERETAPPGTYASVGEVVDINGPDGTATENDTTNLDSTFKETLIGLPNAGNFTFTLNTELDDAQQTKLRSNWATAGEELLFRVVLPTKGSPSTAKLTREFNGKVTSFPESSVQDNHITTSCTIRVLGPITDTYA